MELQKQRIRRLEAAGCRSLRELWEEAFAEDTKLFNDYYFDNKAEKNNALILEEDGKLLSMVSMTPYQVYVLEKKEQPGYGMLEVRPMEEEDIPEVVRFAVPLLERRFQVYTERSAEYYEMMLKEMYAQQGDSFLLLDDKRIVGYFLYSREKGPVIQEALIYPEFEELVLEPDTVSQPAIMGRIISLPDMLSFIRCRQKLDVLLKYEDISCKQINPFQQRNCSQAFIFIIAIDFTVIFCWAQVI